MKLDLSKIRKKDDAFKSIPLGEAIFVDLTPPSHKEVVYLRRLKKQWIYGLFGVFSICVAATLIAVGLNAQSQSALASEMSNQSVISQNTATYSEINRALDLQKNAITNLNRAAGFEIDWNKLISRIDNNLPNGTQISSISVTAGGVKPKSESDPDVSAVINLNLSSDHTLGYSDSLRMIEEMDGVASVEISGLETEGERYFYTLSFTYDTSLLTQRLVQEDNK